MALAHVENPDPPGTAASPSSAPAAITKLVHLVRRQPRRSRWLVAVMVLGLAVLLPELAGVGELTRVQQILLYIMIAFGLNIGLGYAGEFAVAQPVVLGVSAYTAGIMSAEHNVSPWITLPASLVTGCLIGFLLSAPGFRLRGWYLAVTTFFAAVVFPNIVDLFSGTTGGTNGLAGIKPLPGVGLVLGSSARQYWIILGITLVLMLGMYNMSRSTWGVILRGVRDAPLASEACGINVALTKAFVSVVSSVPVAVAGWVWAHASNVISTDSFSLNLSIIIVAGVVLGGMGTVWGPVIGTVIVEIVSLWIGPFSDYNNLLVGGAVVLFAIAMPRGMIHAWGAAMARAGERLGWRGTLDAGPAESTEGSGPDEPGEALMAGPGDAVAAGVPGSGVLTTSQAATPPTEVAGPSPDAVVTSAPDLVDARGDGHAGTIGDLIFDVTGVHKRFSGVSVLEGVDLEVRRGEVVGLIGPNGSGKTTLLNVITGHVSADQGQASLFGKQVLGRSPHTIAGRGIRRTFQVPRLIGELSVLENVRLGLLGARRQEVLGSILQLPGYRARARSQLAEIERVCDLVGLDPSIRHGRVDGLPLGTRRVVEVARAVVSGPALVCLDEPGAGLAGAELVRLGQVMRRVADAGSGVLVIEHNLDFVREITDRIVEMRDGRVVDYTGSPAATALPGEEPQ